MTLGTLRLGMALDPEDPQVAARHQIDALRSGNTSRGKLFRQFSFGRMDTQEMCITEGIVVDGIVDSLMRTWLWSWKMEDQLQKGLFCLSALFAERSDAHAKKSPCLTTSMDETMYAAMARHPGKTGLAVQQAIMSCIQAGIRPLARIIYVEEEDFNTVYELELFPSRRMFQLRETITLRN